MKLNFRHPVWPWIGLTVILVLHAVAIQRLHPENYFGMHQDDSVYLSSAHSIAEGDGYVLPSVPGTPPATKYPVLYPWMLSWIWRANIPFPANIRIAIAISEFFTLAFGALAFLLLRRFRRINSLEALLLTAACVFHPAVMFLGANIMSDMPFCAFVLAALLLADSAMRPAAGIAKSALSACFTGLSILCRVLGVPVAAGIFISGVLRKSWRQPATFAAITAAFFAPAAWSILFPKSIPPPASLDAFGPGWPETWFYYTNYFAFRKLDTTAAHAGWATLVNQFTYFVTQLPSYFLSPLFNRNIPLLFVATLVVFWMILAGIVRLIRTDGWKPLYAVLPFYFVMVLLWDYPDWRRFIICFLPLFAAALWLEGKRAIGRCLISIRENRSTGDKAVAATALVALLALAFSIAINLVTGERSSLRDLTRDRASLLAEKREAYDWLRANAPQDARVIAGEDVCVYLYTGRQAMTSLAFLHAGAYDDTIFQRDLDHITDVARAIGAKYWLASPDDSDKQWVAAKPRMEARLQEVESVLPELFRSTGGRVKIYALPCIEDPATPSCEASERVLFPWQHRSVNP